MYPEFIIIYVALGIITILLAAVIVLLILLLRRTRTDNTGYTPADKVKINSTGIAFCKNCATPFNASTGVCPKCGTPRQ